MVVMSSLPPPSQGVQHVQNNTRAFVNENCMGTGTLYIAEARLSWCDGQGRGFSLEYPAISVHAICKDTTKFPHECIYCMIDSPLDDNNDDNNEDKIGEVRFVPEEKGSLEHMFAIMSDCQVLHPDPQEEAEEEMAGFGGEYFTSEDDAYLTEEGQATLDRLEGTLQSQADQAETMVTLSTTNGKAPNGHTQNPDVEMEEEAGQFEDA